MKKCTNFRAIDKIEPVATCIRINCKLISKVNMIKKIVSSLQRNTANKREKFMNVYIL